MEIDTKIILGNCCEKLKEIGDNSIDLIFTSPPYADHEKIPMVEFIPTNM